MDRVVFAARGRQVGRAPPDVTKKARGNVGTATGTPVAMAALVMQLLRKAVSLAVPISVAVVAFLHAQAVGSLIDAAVTPAASVAPFAEARAAALEAPDGSALGSARSADPLLDRNPFDHLTNLHPLRVLDAGGDDVVTDDDPMSASPCEGVRVTVTFQGEDQGASLAAFVVGEEPGASNRSVLRQRGGDVGGMRVVYVGRDRVWLSRGDGMCQTQVFDDRASARPAAPSPGRPGALASPTAAESPLEKELASKIVKAGPNEYEIDRGAVDRILEAQAELMKTPLVPEKDGDRVVGYRMTRIRPGSVLSAIGLVSNDRLVAINGALVTSTERMLEVYAKLKTGNVERVTISVVRDGKPTNVDLHVK